MSKFIPKKILLGSGSRSRKLILEEMGVSFQVVKADIDERAIGDRSHADLAGDLVSTLAKEKARAILDKLPEDCKGLILLTADQVVCHKGEILEKPSTPEEATNNIRSFGFAPCSTVGSILLTNTATGKQVEEIDVSNIYFSQIPEEIIQQLVEEGEVMNCAGGLMIEHPLIQPYLSRIEGTQDSVMGLSKALVAELFEKLEKDP